MHTVKIILTLIRIQRVLLISPLRGTAISSSLFLRKTFIKDYFNSHKIQPVC